MNAKLLLIASTCFVLTGCGSSGSSDGDAVNINNLLNESNSSGTFALKGSIILSDEQFSDADTSADSTSANSNDSFDSAQLIANQSVVNGYLGAIGSANDEQDFYKVQLASGDQLRITYSGVEPSLTVMTYDAAAGATTVATGANAGSQQLSATVAAKQTFYVRVTSTGQTQYILQTGQVTSSFALKAAPARPENPFVPGDIIVKFKQNSQHKFARRGGDAISNDRAQLRQLSDFTATDTAFKPSASQSIEEQTLALVEMLNQRDDVEYASVNGYFYPNSLPNDNYYSSQWNMHMVNAAPAWQYQGTNEVIVAVIDSGIARISDNGGLRDHSDLEGSLVPGFDFVKDIERADDGDGIDKDSRDTGDAILNSGYHGTHVAGVIAAKANNGIGIAGVAGAASNIKVMPIRVLAGGFTTAYDLAQAILFAAGEPSDADEIVGDRTNADGSHNHTPRAQVINMSLGGLGEKPPVLFDAVEKAAQAGVILVGAAGNEATDGYLSFPAAFSNVISVAAQNNQGELASYSNYGATVDVSAPGGGGSTNTGLVLSTYATGRSSLGVAESYEYLSGTSMAAPVVAGVIALMKSIDPSITKSDIDTYLRNGDIVDPLFELADEDKPMGYGSINALKAVAFVSGDNVIAGAPILRITPTSVNISYSQRTSQVLLYNGGVNTKDDVLEIEAITTTSKDSDTAENERWLTVTDSTRTTLGALTLSANKGYTDGIYTDTLTVQSNMVDGAGAPVSVSVPVRMEINTNLKQYIEPTTVSLYKLDENGLVTTDVVASTSITSTDDGEYSYTFPAVPKGTYYLTAGSNTNGNDTVCEEAELCSVAGVLGSRIITVNSALKANISMATKGINVP